MPLNDDPDALPDAKYWEQVDELAGGSCCPIPSAEVDAAVARLDAANG